MRFRSAARDLRWTWMVLAANRTSTVQKELQEAGGAGYRYRGELSAAYAAKHLARSLELLHVAAAQAVGRTTFASADDRQLAVVTASGLRIVDIKRRIKR